jgi:hypothetical protein
MTKTLKKNISKLLLLLFCFNSSLPLFAGTIKAGSAVSVRLDQTLSSNNSSVGAFVYFTVVNDVFDSEGNVVIKTGAKAEGTVTSVKAAGLLGQAGSIGISVNTVTAIDGTRIPVQAISSGSGEDKMVVSVILGLLCILGFLMKGGDAELNSNTVIPTRTLGDFDISLN